MSSDPLNVGKDWFAEMGWTPFAFQLEAWQAYVSGYSGLVNAPTGSGKTYSLMMPLVVDFLSRYPSNKERKNAGLHAIWITPIRALSKEIELAAKRLIDGLDVHMTVGVRSGDTSLKERIYAWKDLWKNIEALREDLRAPFKLHTSGYKYHEIAERLNIPIGTVKNRIFQARKELQGRLA